VCRIRYRAGFVYSSSTSITLRWGFILNNWYPSPQNAACSTTYAKKQEQKTIDQPQPTNRTVCQGHTKRASSHSSPVQLLSYTSKNKNAPSLRPNIIHGEYSSRKWCFAETPAIQFRWLAGWTKFRTIAAAERPATQLRWWAGWNYLGPFRTKAVAVRSATQLQQRAGWTDVRTIAVVVRLATQRWWWAGWNHPRAITAA